MDKINKERIQRLFQNTGDSVVGKLLEHPNHPNVRNPYAYVALKAQDRFGCSYEDIADEKYIKVGDILIFVNRDEG